jgi:group I intron endonuclease
MANLYFHKRLDDDTIFYVGIGKTKKRAYSKCDRNNHWKNVANKHGYEVVIFERGLTWERACELEKLYIRLLGRRDLGLGNLVNLTDGGEGTLGRPPTNKGKPCSNETKRKISTALKGKASPHKGRTHSDETKRKWSEARKGKVLSDETKQKMSVAQRGGNNPSAKKCINTLTGQIYPSLKDAALDLGINYNTFKVNVRNGVGNIKYLD